MSKSGKPSSRPRSRRWLFITIVVTAALYLALFLRAFLLEADMSLGLSRISGSGLAGLVVYRSSYAPPTSGVLTVHQVGVLLEAAEAMDSCSRSGLSAGARRVAFANVLNRYTTTLSEYRWIRTTAVPLVASVPRRPTHADSANYEVLRMQQQRLARIVYVFRDSLDREAFDG